MIGPIVSGAALPEIALDALRRGESLGAYYAADRWIRLAGANANNLLLRAEAARRLGLIDAAIGDLQRGLTQDPLNRLLNRRLMEWADGADRLEAARALLSSSRREAEVGLKILAEAGEIGAGAVQIEDGFAVGWLAWRPNGAAQLQFSGQKAASQTLQADPNHPLAAIFGAAVDFRLACTAPPSSRVSLLVDRQRLAMARAPGAPVWPDEAPVGGPETAITVIVPVYDDYEATRDCLLSLAVEVESTPNAEALVIDDETPEPRIRGLLACFAEWEHCRVVKNPSNLGFVAAVNRALKLAPHGDVLLLNADARLPRGALARLSEAARAHPGVGVVNPLSNHGEFVSYPKPFRHNAFDEEQWRAIDRAAARSGQGRVIDIPSATGFCMYVTRACLDAIGGLSQAFGDGYLEDADFGLRAREAGFRNVCAPSVYVPHIGSRSFKQAKKALVARNRGTLKRRFPDYEAECRAFLDADPLASARAGLEIALASESPKRRLLVGPARWRDALQQRAGDLAEAGVGAVVAVIEGGRLMVRGADDGAPQNVEIECGADGAAAWRALRNWRFDRIEYFWTPEAPAALRRAMEGSFLPLDIVLAAAPSSQRECAALRGHRLFALDAFVERACKTFGLSVSRWRSHPRQSASALARIDLAILHPFETASSRRFLLALAQALIERGRTALLIGAASRDEPLLAQGLMATGPIAREDWPRLLEIYAPRRLALPYRDEGFWAIEAARSSVDAPAVFFDPTGSGFSPTPEDLPLEADSDDETAAADMLDWAFSDGMKRPVTLERAVA